MRVGIPAVGPRIGIGRLRLDRFVVIAKRVVPVAFAGIGIAASHESVGPLRGGELCRKRRNTEIDSLFMPALSHSSFRR